MARGVPLGVLIRRVRTERALTQRALAQAAGVAQATLSYYENGQLSPSPEAIARLEQALRLKRGELQVVMARAGGEATAARAAEPPRSAFLATLSILGRVSAFDRPAGEDGGDLAFAVDLRSHAFLLVVDAEGSGPLSAPLARVAAACAFGATVAPGGGVPTPEDIVDATVRFWRLVGASPRSAALCVVSFDLRARRIHQCRLGMPPPYLRSGRLAQWTGKPDGPAGAFVGERVLEDDALLVVATDGVAHMPTKGERALWDAPEFRTLLTRATDPADVTEMLARRAGEAARGERLDDRLAVAVMPWRS